MKNMSATKKLVVVLSIVLLVLAVAQIACMFLPYFNFAPLKSKKHPDPVPTDYSLMNYCWTHCEEMTAYFEKQIKGYSINDYVVGLALSLVFAIIAILMNFSDLKNQFSKYSTVGITALRILANIFTFIWVGYSLSCYLTNGILAYASPVGSVVRLVSIVVIAIAAVVAIVRTVASIAPKLSKKSKAAAR